MASATCVKWVESRQFVGTDSTGHSVVISSPDDGVGCKPSDLLLLAMGSCAAYDVVSILEKKRQKLTGLEVTVTGEQDGDAPWAFRRLHTQFTVRGRELKEKAVRDAIELSETKYCSVAATLRGSVELSHAYTIVEDEP
jgi:putative redox protein